MKIRKLTSSFLLILLLSIIIFLLIKDEPDSLKSITQTLSSFFSDFISYKQTGVNIAILRIGKLTLKLDLELIQNIRNKFTDVFMITINLTPKFISNFIRDFAAAVKEIIVSFYEVFSQLAQKL